MGEKAESEKRELLLFDVCDTLYFANTTFDFIKFVLERNHAGAKLKLFNLLTSRFSPVFAALAAWQKFTANDATRGLALQLLRGFSKAQLEKEGENFVTEFLNSRKVKQTHSLLADLRLGSGNVLLISASIEPVIGAIARELNAAYRCSALRYENEIFSGYLAEDMTGKKEVALKDFLEGNSYAVTVVTDNFTDYKLMQAAGKRYAVVYSNKAKQFWASLNPEFIMLDPL